MVDAVRLPRRIVAAIALLLGAWTISPAVIPLYDGPGFPDQPYRYVVRPPGDNVTTPPPTTASSPIPVRNGVSTAAFANSGESGPQISVYIPAGSLQAPAGATKIQLTASPSAPKPPLPTDGTIVSNVYTITATASGGAVAIIGKGDNQTPTLQMRAPTAQQPGPTFETFDGKKWTSTQTIRVGTDIYQTFAPKLGVWALVQQKTTGGSAGLNGASLVLLILGISILALVAIILLVRFARSRTAPAPANARGRPPAKRTTARR